MKRMLLTIILISTPGFGSQTGGSGHSIACAGGPPVYCPPQDLSINSAQPPAALVGATGAGKIAIDPFSGERILRVTDYNTLTGAQASFSTNSTSENMAWSSDGTIFLIHSLGKTAPSGGFGGMLFQFNPATMTATLKSPSNGAVTDTNGRTVPNDAMDFGYAAADAGVIFGWYNSTTTGERSADKWTVNTGSTPWNTTSSVIMRADSTENDCVGLNIRTDGSLGTGPVLNKYSVFGDTGLSNDDTRGVSMWGVRQDEDSIILVWDSTRPQGSRCLWLDTRRGLVGGWGLSGTTNLTPFGPLPAPTSTAFPSANVAGTSGGSLVSGHTYNIAVTYVVYGVGESTALSYTNVGPINNTALQITAPATLTATAPRWITNSGYNVYACDSTVNPGCTPVLQQDSSLTGVPANLTATCNAACTGSNTYTYWVVAENANHASNPSLPVSVTTAQGQNSQNNTIGWDAVPGATAYDLMRDDLGQVVKKCYISGGSPLCTVSPSCPNGKAVCYTDNSGALAPFVVEDNFNAATMTITTLASATATPPTQSTAGFLLHDLKIDRTGNWIRAETKPPVASSQQEGSYVGKPTYFFWYIGDTALNTDFTCGNVNYSYGDILPPCGDHVARGYNMHEGSGGYNFIDRATFQLIAPINTAAMQATVNHFVPFSLTTGLAGTWNSHQSWGDDDPNNTRPMIDSTYCDTCSMVPNGAWQGEILGITPAAVGQTGPVYRFGKTWATALGAGFWSSARGNVSRDGKWFLFTSDMLAGASDGTGACDGSGNHCAVIGTVISPSDAHSLGNYGGTNGCTIDTATSNTTSCRGDVFLIELK